MLIQVFPVLSIIVCCFEHLEAVQLLQSFILRCMPAHLSTFLSLLITFHVKRRYPT